MKKLIFTMAILLVSTMAFAQIQKGDIQITGNIGYNKTRPYITQNIPYETSRVTISSKAGMFLSETISLGGILGYTGAKSQDLNIFNVGAYARFHKSIAENFYLYLEPSFSYGFSSRIYDTIDAKLSPGMTYFMSPKFALDLNSGMIGYSKNVSGIESYSFNLNLSNITLGASFYIR
ncbi:outer membrane protein with beta-barrel domain [Roseivirga ehrenbergii]|nr:outer membrane beta-barrel protein [Roseivirga ehrenbergii]TCL01023.1 outer membrane protein with beta-barrel domain [Roseivirga ehrenbergii]